MRRAPLGLLFVFVSACATASLSACSGGNFEVPGGPTDSTPGDDGSSADTSLDTSVVDTGADDTGGADTIVDDTGVTDAHKKDSASDSTTDAAPDSPPDDGGIDARDSAVVDTGTDSGKSDTGTLDAGPPDTGKPDSGLPEIGPACPMPKNGTVVSEPTGNCMELTTALANAFESARTCGCDADCSQTGGPNGCACPSYINPGSAGYPTYVATASAYEKGMCKGLCPGLPCTPASPVCVMGKCALPGSVITLDAGP